MVTTRAGRGAANTGAKAITHRQGRLAAPHFDCSREFKRATVQRILSGKQPLAELSRELDISPGVIRSWTRFAEAAATTAVQAREDVVPASQLREVYAPIRELERAGPKTMEVGILRTAQEVVKKTPLLRRESAGHAVGDRGRIGTRLLTAPKPA